MAASVSSSAQNSGVVSRVLSALRNDAYVWRTMAGIEEETGLPQQEVVEALKLLPPNEELIVANGRGGQPLYSTRSHYRQRQSIGGKLLSALSGELK